MGAAEASIPSLLLPVRGSHLLLPQAAVAEIIKHPEVTPQAEAPGWLRGLFKWREEALPLIAFEGMCGDEFSASEPSERAVVVYALKNIANVVFYALELQATPSPVTVTRDMLVHKDSGEDHNVIACTVMLDGQQAIVPALSNLETLIRDHV